MSDHTNDLSPYMESIHTSQSIYREDREHIITPTIVDIAISRQPNIPIL
ncbi:MAG: hypothetical protein QW552_06685 [Ignisphaera sp.]